ncbi:hypothetical protein [Bacillus velezensis]|uniref:hypothetical protein n=1 Tax=Bacillus velezensis TaxID=492670 RepID=UPI00119FACC9|nr:hypothetical protein [Bacillus velezensis]
MNNEIFKESKKRAPSQRDRILNLLREKGDKGILNIELVDICIGYRSRIAELYQMGYKIDVENVEQGVCIYTLKEEPETPRTNIPSAVSVVMEEIQSSYDGSITADDLAAILNNMNFNIVRKHGSFKSS